MQILDFVDFHNTWLSVSSAEAVEGRDSPGFAGLAATDRSVQIFCRSSLAATDLYVQIFKLDWCNIQNRYILVKGTDHSVFESLSATDQVDLCIFREGRSNTHKDKMSSISMN